MNNKARGWTAGTYRRQCELRPLEEYPSSAVHRTDFPSISPRLSNRVNKGPSSHRRQPTRLPRPWDSPGKNTGVGCQFLLQCRKVKNESEVAQSCPVSDSSRPHGLQPTRLLCPWKFPGKSTGVGCHCLDGHD